MYDAAHASGVRCVSFKGRARRAAPRIPQPVPIASRQCASRLLGAARSGPCPEPQAGGGRDLPWPPASLGVGSGPSAPCPWRRALPWQPSAARVGHASAVDAGGSCPLATVNSAARVSQHPSSVPSGPCLRANCRVLWQICGLLAEPLGAGLRGRSRPSGARMSARPHPRFFSVFYFSSTVAFLVGVKWRIINFSIAVDLHYHVSLRGAPQWLDANAPCEVTPRRVWCPWRRR